MIFGCQNLFSENEKKLVFEYDESKYGIYFLIGPLLRRMIMMAGYDLESVWVYTSIPL